MAKIIRLTESDLNKIVKRVLREQSEQDTIGDVLKNRFQNKESLYFN